MNKIQFVPFSVKEFHAGSKALSDVADIADIAGFQRICVDRKEYGNSFINKIYSLVWWLKSCLWLLRIPRNAIVLINYPTKVLSGRLGVMFLRAVRNKLNARLLAVVHDISALRGRAPACENGIEGPLNELIKLSSRLIVHNELMKQWLENHGVATKKMVVLGVFDYLLKNRPSPKYATLPINNVAIAGNLNAEKAAYLCSLNKVPYIQWQIYGVNYDANTVYGDNVFYNGAYPPDVLPEKLNAHFGLVWDGSSIDTCEGYMGEYLSYNNPHKLSLYLASGLPVIVWKKSALSDWILQRGLGIAVESLYEIPNVLKDMPISGYNNMLANVELVSRKLQTGHYMKTAIEFAVELIQKEI